MSNTTIYTRRPGSTATDNFLEAALGVKRMNYPPAVFVNNSAPATQTIYAIGIPTVAGEAYTGVTLALSVAGAGTPPTGFFVGLATFANIGSTGAMLAQSSNLASSTSLTTAGYQQFAFSSAYTESATGLRMIVILENGTWGTTQMTAMRANNTNPGAGIGLFQLAGTSQTALPANGSNLPAVYSSASNISFWAGLY